MSSRSGTAAVAPGMIARRLVVRTRDVAFLKGIVEAHEGLAQVYAERGGDLLLVSTEGRERELDQLARDLATELDGILTPLPSEDQP